MQERQPYSTDLTDAQWVLLEPFFLVVNRPDKRNGRPRVYSYREILDGIFYVLRTGCAWRLLPHDLPPWLTCYGCFNRLSRKGLWEKIHAALREVDRVRVGREPTPSAAVLDSQSVKTTEKGVLKRTTTLEAGQTTSFRDPLDLRPRARLPSCGWTPGSKRGANSAPIAPMFSPPCAPSTASNVSAKRSAMCSIRWPKRLPTG